MQIHLNKIKVYAYHGWYEEERKTGHWFEVTVKLTMPDPHDLNDELSGTLNYETIYALVLETMNKPQRLLETVAQQLITELQRINSISKASVKLSKLSPAMMDQTKKVSIVLKFKR